MARDDLFEEIEDKDFFPLFDKKSYQCEDSDESIYTKESGVREDDTTIVLRNTYDTSVNTRKELELVYYANLQWVKYNKDKIWIFDSGASMHMTRCKQGFVTLRKERNNISFALSKGKTVAEHMGDWKGQLMEPDGTNRTTSP